MRRGVRIWDVQTQALITGPLELLGKGPVPLLFLLTEAVSQQMLRWECSCLGFSQRRGRLRFVEGTHGSREVHCLYA
jgi:hypothetical protein